MANATSQEDLYWPITIARSDGQGYTTLDHAPLNPNDEQDIAQHERWLVIIAGHLQMQLAPKEDKKQYKLTDFPRGYELRVAVRNSNNKDYYLYGHPAGAKAIFRTPGDFALHALWLASNSKDQNDCSCDLCPRYVEQVMAQRERERALMQQPQQLQPQFAPQAQQQPQPQFVPQSQQQPQSQFVPQAQQQPQVAQQTQNQLVQQQQQQPQQQQQQQKQPQQQQAQQQQAQQQQAQQQQAQQQQAQQQQAQQQQTALTSSTAVRIPPGTSGFTNVFRVGEMVWYKHAAWRLGIILAITPRAGSSIPVGASDSSFNFTIAPLGHAILKQEPLIKDAMSMRPFLTFSVPATAYEELKEMSFEDVNWTEYVTRQATEPDATRRNTIMQTLGLEASKLGARSTNDSCSFFNKIYDDLTGDQLYRMQCYVGVYLGAEMVLVNDPIRVAATAQQTQLDPSITDITLVMRIEQIMALTSRTQPNSRPVLQFRGNTYRTVRTPTNAPPPNERPAESIGPAFVEELLTRNNVEKDKSMRWWWVLVEENAVRQENDVTGRYYATEKLMTIIDPERYQEWVANGVLEDPPAYLNTRAQSGMGNGYTGRRPGRAAALGDKIGVPFKAPDRIDEDTE